MKRYLLWSLILLVVAAVVAAPPASAQAGLPQAASTPPASGFRAEFLYQSTDAEQKLVSLAGAIPQEKYAWRPMEGVRSVSEVFLHVARANFTFPTFLGIPAPAGIDRQGLEKSTTEKSKVVEVLKQSFEYARQAALKIPDADLDKPVKMFGREVTVRAVLFTLALHQHEHLGQSIAYARSNSVVPPWTATRQARPPQRQP
jgi:uncharacterized damage-inducible protein DinB